MRWHLMCFRGLYLEPHVSKEGAIPGYGLQEVKIAMYLPRELMASFYHYGSGELFYYHMAGLPSDAGLLMAN